MELRPVPVLAASTIVVPPLQRYRSPGSWTMGCPRCSKRQVGLPDGAREYRQSSGRCVDVVFDRSGGDVSRQAPTRRTHGFIKGGACGAGYLGETDPARRALGGPRHGGGRAFPATVLRQYVGMCRSSRRALRRCGYRSALPSARPPVRRAVTGGRRGRPLRQLPLYLRVSMPSIGKSADVRLRLPDLAQDLALRRSGVVLARCMPSRFSVIIVNHTISIHWADREIRSSDGSPGRGSCLSPRQIGQIRTRPFAGRAVGCCCDGSSNMAAISAVRRPKSWPPDALKISAGPSRFDKGMMMLSESVSVHCQRRAGRFIISPNSSVTKFAAGRFVKPRGVGRRCGRERFPIKTPSSDRKCNGG